MRPDSAQSMELRVECPSSRDAPQWRRRRGEEGGRHCRAVLGPNSKNWQGEKLQQLEDHFKVERHTIDKLIGAVGQLERRSATQDAHIARLDKADEMGIKNLLGVERGVMHRIHANKLLAMKDTEACVLRGS